MPEVQATRVPETDVEIGLRELVNQGTLLTWRMTKVNGRRRYLLRFASGELVKWEIGKVWALIRGHRAARLGEGSVG